MDTKINLTQLAKTLAKMKNLTQKDAEAFLREFFDAIIQNVTTEKLVKIKGLGTFKLIEVLDRESVNVNTGERIVIPGHTKLAFTPDASLKDTVNKPFADFQTVVINEGTSLEEMERIPLEQEEEEEPELELESEPESESEQGQELKPELEPELEPEPVSSSEPMLESGSDTKEKTEEDVPVPVALTQQQPSEPNPQKRSHTITRICALVSGIILLVLLSFYAGYEIRNESVLNSEIQEDRQIEQVSENADTLRPAPTPTPTPTPTPASTPPPSKEQNEEIQYAQVNGGVYKIIGTRKTYVMKPGDYLTKIALEEYGDKEVTRYIIVHNRFPDPDNVPVGAEIKLPELEKVK